MKHKTLGPQSATLLAKLNGEGTNAFTTLDAINMMATSPNTVVKLLSDMTDRGLIMRLKSGRYYVIPYDQEAESFLPDWHLVGAQLAGDAKYYIGYYSAMQLHSLITQPSLSEQIVVDRQLRPSIMEVKGVKFQFIYHNHQHFFGSKKIWINGQDRVLCSDLEKTFIDVLFMPEYGGGITEIAKAIYKTRDKINYTQLLKYAERFGSKAVFKRLGYLLELLEIDTPIIDSLRQIKVSGYPLLDPSRPKEGRLISRWNIQENIDHQSILSPIYT
ncbi:type IV toxin-antitoxin system AbiEi family antitoxin [Mucilaginibacter sabulilitoris]|uniref:Type IV toxin-antitoxin system AbiEi family antitoxin n=1 Tax=Mucilaginibacter sabulilitoris TaxID=1173583 RepID=A0ABZ0TL76_9SPHI|nr:type IV toxin-antitoxin system AbiEi family antitoxin [Mucilaginibacter sabulilitoris]WPU92479.1 type IV toxin-antitoxin system AbiEi family antitoxin [Mucilaginibacter sabulilitoris]